jgi:hypothetical protein
MSARHGRILEILTFDDHGASKTALWWAAIDDDAGAIRAVKDAARTLADQGVRVIGHLSPQDVQARGLADGQVVPART